MSAVRFACQPGCTKCCDQRGFVYLSDQDRLRAARYLKMTPAGFESKYCIRYTHLLWLRKPRKRECPFLEDGGCSIHPAKPTQCRLYPYWPELVENRLAWQLEAKKCPGIGQGPLVQIGTACETASEMKRAYPTLY